MLVVTSRLVTGWFGWPAAIAMALFWGFAIVTLDSWLIASLHGGRAKTRVCLPRLLISVLLGFVIAEPIVVAVFRPAIDQRVADNRAAELASVSSTWKACNPPTGEVVDSAACTDHHLNLASSLTAQRTQHETLTAQRTRLKSEVDAKLAQWTELERIAQAECKGTPGVDTTGVPGEGPECTRNRASADQYRRDTKLEQRQADLAALDQDLAGLAESIKQAEKSSGEQIESAIAAKVNDWRASRQTTGMLEELHALGQLADSSTHVDVALWGLRLLLILFDCTPVLTKWLGGRTAYDGVIAMEVATGQRQHTYHLNQRERADVLVWDEQTVIQDRERHRRDRALDEEIERLVPV